MCESLLLGLLGCVWRPGVQQSQWCSDSSWPTVPVTSLFSWGVAYQHLQAVSVHRHVRGQFCVQEKKKFVAKSTRNYQWGRGTPTKLREVKSRKIQLFLTKSLILRLKIWFWYKELIDVRLRCRRSPARQSAGHSGQFRPLRQVQQHGLHRGGSQLRRGIGFIYMFLIIKAFKHLFASLIFDLK